ncbi:hypothetical protein CJP16_11365 [Aeromonas sobria]|uniref:Uncharacterized protein n=1 Tax=Aeromonas sobria TaxID=646 RepID=A0A2N3IY91_AERSO|nr:hypothetical protein CJP16_11365 [Aeromonas sobria]
MRGKAAIGRVKTGFATLGANRVSLGGRISGITEDITIQSGIGDTVRHTGRELVYSGQTSLNGISEKRIIWSSADNPIYRRHLGKQLNALGESVEPFKLFVYGVLGNIFGVELDFTIKNQQVGASRATLAITLLANVVNGGLFM